MVTKSREIADNLDVAFLSRLNRALIEAPDPHRLAAAFREGLTTCCPLTDRVVILTKRPFFEDLDELATFGGDELAKGSWAETQRLRDFIAGLDQPDATQSIRWNSEQSTTIDFLGRPVRSLLALRLRGKDPQYGLAIALSEQCEAFQDGAIQTAEVYSAFAGFQMEASHLREMLSSWREVTAKLRTQGNPRRVVRGIAEDLRQRFSLDACAIWLRTPENGRIENAVGILPCGHSIAAGGIPESLLRRIIVARAPLCTNRASDNETFAAITDCPDLKSVVWASLGLDQGVLALGSFRSLSLDDVDKGMLAAFAGYAAAAIENSESRVNQRQLDILDRIIRDIAANYRETAARDMLQYVVDGAVDLLGGDIGRVIVPDEDMKQISILVSDRNSKDIEGKDYWPIGTGVAGKVIRDGKPLTITNYQSWQDRIEDPGGSPCATVTGVPIMVERALWGVLIVGTNDVEKPFQPRGERLLARLALQAGFAYESICAPERWRAIVQLQAGLAEAYDVTAAAERIAAASRKLLKAECSTVFLLKREDCMRIGADDGVIRSPNRDELEFQIIDGEHTGFTGHLATLGKIFRSHGSSLLSHPAITKTGPVAHIPSGWPFSVISAPILYQNSLIGLIKAENKRTLGGDLNPESRFEDFDEQMIQLLANVAAAGIATAEHRMLERLFDTVSSIVSRQKAPLDNVLESILNEIRTLVPFDSASVHVIDLSTDGTVNSQIIAVAGGTTSHREEALQLEFPCEDPHFLNYEIWRQPHKPFHYVPDVWVKYAHLHAPDSTWCSREIRSWLGIPLLDGDELIGTLALDSHSDNAFTRSHIECLTRLAALISSAIVSRRHAKSQRSAEALLEVLGRVSAGSDPSSVLQSILNHLTDQQGMFRVDNALIFPFSEETGRFSGRPLTAGGIFETDKIPNNLAPDAVVWRFIGSQEPYFAKTVDARSKLWREFAAREHVASAAVYPLLADGKTLGLLFLNYTKPHVFESTEKRLFRLFAQGAAIAFRNATSLETAKQQHRNSRLDQNYLLMLVQLNHQTNRYLDPSTLDIATAVNKLKSDPPDIDGAVAVLEKITLSRVTTLPIDKPTLNARSRICLHDAVQTLFSAKAAGNPRVEIDLTGLKDAPPVDANDWFITTVFGNLFDNSVEYARSLPVRIRVSAQKVDTTVTVIYRDWGTGIDKSIRSKLFKDLIIREPGHLGGDGRGLWICGVAMSALGGSIEVQETTPPDQGATFKIVFRES